MMRSIQIVVPPELVAAEPQILSLILADLLEVQRLILQWGGLAEAVEPPELRQRLAAAATKLKAAHD